MIKMLKLKYSKFKFNEREEEEPRDQERKKAKKCLVGGLLVDKKILSVFAIGCQSQHASRWRRGRFAMP